MARMSGESIIQQKITELDRQITHFEECIKQAKAHQVILGQALIALQVNPFSTPVKRKQEHILPIEISPYSRRSSELIAKVFKRYPNQWMSANEIMWKVIGNGKENRG